MTELAGGDAAVANAAARLETENNYLGPVFHAEREQIRENLRTNIYSAQSLRRLIQLDTQDQYSDALLAQYLNDPTSLNNDERQRLASYLQSYYVQMEATYGSDVAQKAYESLITPGDTLRAYIFPYAMDGKTQEDAANTICARCPAGE